MEKTRKKYSWADQLQDNKICQRKLLKKLTKEIRKIVDKGYERARKVLTEKIDDLHKLAKALLTYETLNR